MKKTLAAVLAAIVVLSSICISVPAFASPFLQKEEYTDLLKFTATTLDNEVITQDDLADYDVTVFYFWSTTCGYCVDEMPDLELLKESLPDNVQMISVCLDAVFYKDLAERILKKTGFDVQTIIGGRDDMATLINQVMYTPTAIFVDNKGVNLAEPLIGAPKDVMETYNEILDDILPEKDIKEEGEDNEDSGK